MEGQPVEGVIQNADQTQDQLPPDSPAVGKEEVFESDEVEKVPFGKHPRWQKMVAENNRLKQIETQFKKVQEAEGEVAALKDLDKRIRAAGPETAKALINLLYKEEAKAQGINLDEKQEDPYAGMDPKMAEYFKKQEIMEKALIELYGHAKQQKEQEKQAVEEVWQEYFDEKFANDLERDGFISANGEMSEEQATVIESVATSALLKFAKNPANPTEEEYTKAYSFFKKALNKAGMFGKTKSRTSVPPSGSSFGRTATTEGKKDFSFGDAVNALKEVTR